MVIVDTDILIKCLGHVKAYKEEVTKLLEAQAAILTPVQVAEVYSHALHEELPLIGTFFDLFKMVDFDRSTANLAGEFYQQYKAFYPELSISDCLVGAAAALGEHEIYTMTANHFPMTEVKLYSKTIASLTARTKTRLQNNAD